VDALVDRLGPDAGQRAMVTCGEARHWGHGRSQEPVGHGEDRTAADSRSGQPDGGRRLSGFVSRCWPCSVINVLIRASPVGSWPPAGAGMPQSPCPSKRTTTVGGEIICSNSAISGDDLVTP
jgi:hypothetical protein